MKKETTINKNLAKLGIRALAHDLLDCQECYEVSAEGAGKSPEEMREKIVKLFKSDFEGTEIGCLYYYLKYFFEMRRGQRKFGCTDEEIYREIEAARKRRASVKRQDV